MKDKAAWCFEPFETCQIAVARQKPDLGFTLFVPEPRKIGLRPLRLKGRRQIEHNDAIATASFRGSTAPLAVAATGLATRRIERANRVQPRAKA